MSFFNDDEGPQSPSSPGQTRRGAATRPRPRPRRAQHGAVGHAGDRSAVMMRRRVAAAVAVVTVILIAIAISAIIQSAKASALESYGREVNQIAHESQQQVGKRLFAVLVDAGSKQAIGVQQQLNQLHSQAQQAAERAGRMGVPGGAAEAQRNLVLALQLRAEAIAKIKATMRTALGGGKVSQSGPSLAGDMQILLASDVVWSTRVAPLAAEALAAGGLSGRSIASSRSLPNLGWLHPETAVARITGNGGAESGGPLAPGTHGDALTGVAVGTTALQAEPALNTVPGGESPTFTVSVQDTGENPESGVKVDVEVVSAGSKVTGSQTIETIEPGQTLSVEVPVSGVTPGVSAVVQVKVVKVPGETNLENNQASYQATFE